MSRLTDACHGHVYFDDGRIEAAHTVYERLSLEFPQFSLGRIHDKPVGPHPCRQFQILVPSESLAEAIKWLEQNRLGLTVFWHPVIEDDLYAHTDAAFWLGEPETLKLACFR